MALAFLALTASYSAEGQQPEKKVPRIGYLSLRAGIEPREEAFLKGLREIGYVDGQDIVIEWRFAKGKADLLPGRWFPLRLKTAQVCLLRTFADELSTEGLDGAAIIRDAKAGAPYATGDPEGGSDAWGGAENAKTLHYIDRLRLPLTKRNRRKYVKHVVKSIYPIEKVGVIARSVSFLRFKSRSGDHRHQVSKCVDSLYGCCQLFGIGNWSHLVDV